VPPSDFEFSPPASVFASVHASAEQSGMGAGSLGAKNPLHPAREAAMIAKYT